ncbi:MAG: hypothetical protein ACXWLH_04920 [Candidatus Saccharimonadales bacterium]
MPAKKNKSSVKSFRKRHFWSAWSKNRKIAVIFMLAFAIVGGSLLIKSFAASGDELQAKGNATFSLPLAKRILVAPDGSYGYTLDAYGAIHPFKTFAASMPKAPLTSAYWPNWDIARDMVITKWDAANGPRGYVLDGLGGVHPFGGATKIQGVPYWPNWDIARRIVLRGSGGYVLDGLGGLHPFKIGANGVAPPPTNGWRGYYPNDAARGVVIRGDGKVGAVLDCHGGISIIGFGATVSSKAVYGDYPENRKTCDYVSITDFEWSKPSGTVVNSRGKFNGFNTWYVHQYFETYINKGVDAASRIVNGVKRYWVLDSSGAIRLFTEPNQPLLTDAEQNLRNMALNNLAGSNTDCFRINSILADPNSRIANITSSYATYFNNKHISAGYTGYVIYPVNAADIKVMADYVQSNYNFLDSTLPSYPDCNNKSVAEALTRLNNAVENWRNSLEIYYDGHR